MPALESLPRKIGPYRVLEKIGEGGMGVVYLASDAENRQVAVKVLGPAVAGDPDARLRLAREVETMRRVSKPHVAQVLDADVNGPSPYIVTRYVPGPSLDAAVRQSGPLRGRALLQLAGGLAEALAAIHATGVVHRDLKPGNVLLDDGQPVVIDFGIAHLPDTTRLTKTGLVMGTPGYLSPEVIEGRPASGATDVHAWGATVAFAATGRPPYGTGDFQTVFFRIIEGKAELAGVPPELLPLVTAALSADPPSRPTARSLVSLCAASGANGATLTLPDAAAAARAGAGGVPALGPIRPNGAPGVRPRGLAAVPIAGPGRRRHGRPAPAGRLRPPGRPRGPAAAVARAGPPGTRNRKRRRPRPAVRRAGRRARRGRLRRRDRRRRAQRPAPGRGDDHRPRRHHPAARGRHGADRADRAAQPARRPAERPRAGDRDRPLDRRPGAAEDRASRPAGAAGGGAGRDRVGHPGPGGTLPAALSWGAGAAVAMYCVGPGSRAPRRQLRRMSAAVIRTRGVLLVACISTMALALAVVSSALSQPPLIWPATSSTIPHLLPSINMLPSVGGTLHSVQGWLLRHTVGMLHLP